MLRFLRSRLAPPCATDQRVLDRLDRIEAGQVALLAVAVPKKPRGVWLPMALLLCSLLGLAYGVRLISVAGFERDLAEDGVEDARRAQTAASELVDEALSAITSSNQFRATVAGAIASMPAERRVLATPLLDALEVDDIDGRLATVELLLAGEDSATKLVAEFQGVADHARDRHSRAVEVGTIFLGVAGALAGSFLSIVYQRLGEVLDYLRWRRVSS